jgi:hypothetical protein
MALNRFSFLFKKISLQPDINNKVTFASLFVNKKLSKSIKFIRLGRKKGFYILLKWWGAAFMNIFSYHFIVI